MAKKAAQPRPLRGTLSQEAYLSIRRKILRGELPPGASVSRRPLAKELGMSFLPISEALQRLEQEGLVESWPRVGTRVRIPRPQDVRGTYVIREALESQSARLFSEKASVDERNELRRMAEQVDEAQADPGIDFFDFFSQHERLHRRIAECTGVPALAEALVRNNILIRTWLYAAVSDFREMPADYHRNLIEVLATGTPDEADAVMRQHVRHGMEEVLDRLERHFNWDESAEYPVLRAR